MNENELKPLSNIEIEERLKNVTGWSYKDDKISKEFTFETFPDAIMFVNMIASFSNKVEHHPDIHIFYNKILFELQTFDSGAKVTEKDFIVAKEIERLVQSLSSR